MEGSGWRPAQGDPGMASGDWRSELSTESRQRIVNKITDTLKKHFPEGLSELNKIAVRFEEKVYAAATSQPDYLRTISLEMLTMESKSSNSNPLASNSAAGIQNSQDPAPQFQSQRVLPEASSAPMETTPQAMHATTIDWQEEVYQKIKALKDLYFDKLNDLYQKFTLKCQQQDALGQTQMRSDLIDKLRNYRNVLKTILTYLTIPKNGISPGFKDKIGSFERQILCILNMARKPTQNQQGQQQQLPPPSGGQSLSVQQQQQQLPPPSGGQSLSLQQQQQHQPQPQISQLQHNESHASQLQSVNLQNSLNSMQSSTMTTMQHGSMPLGQNAGIPTSQQNMRNVLQSGSHMDSTLANNLVQQPKNLKRSCSHVMGKEKKCRMSCAVEEENLCAICLDPVMDNGDRSTAKLRCSHQFHLDCIGSAFNAKDSMQCPTCRRVENGQWRFCR